MDRLIATATLVLIVAAGTAYAQGMADMRGMGAQQDIAAHGTAPTKPAAEPRPHPVSAAGAATSPETADMPGLSMPPAVVPASVARSPAERSGAGVAADPMAGMDHAQMAPSDTPVVDAGSHDMAGMHMVGR